MVKGKEKGSQFERVMCSRLSLWVSDSKREDVFWRSAMSGGRATVHMKASKDTGFDAHAGDLTATHDSGHLLLRLFIVECKFWMRIDYDGLLYELKSLIGKEWEKLCLACKEQKRHPMLLAKQNHRAEMVLLNSEGLRILSRAASEPLRVRASFPYFDMHIIALSNMMVDVPFSEIRRRFKLRPEGYVEVPEAICG